MVAPLVAAAGISAAGSLLGGLFGGGSAKKAAKIQQQTAREQIAANERARTELVGLSQPAIDRGNAAGNLYSGLLGAGGDSAASAAALDTWRNSVGYQDLLDTGLGAVNAGAYARGTGDSGATLKALQRTGMGLANQTQQQYLGNLNTLIQTGNSAIGNVSGVTTAITGANNAALQNAADASSNAALAQGVQWQNLIRNATNIGASFAGGMGSSYGGSTGSTGYARGGLPLGIANDYDLPIGRARAY